MLSITIPKYENLRDRIGDGPAETFSSNLVKVLHGLLRDNDHLCVIGSAHFLVVLPATDEKGVERVNKRLSQTLEKFKAESGDRRIENLLVVLKAATTRPTPEVLPEEILRQIERQKPLREPLRLAA